MVKKKKLILLEDSKGEEFVITQDILTRAILHLKEQQKKKLNGKKIIRKGNCMYRQTDALKVEKNVMLRCRQLPNVVAELRKAVLKQNWNEVAILLMLLCHPGLKCYNTIIVRTCFLLLINHPKSSFNLLKKFIRNCTGYVLNEDLIKFIKILFVLCEQPIVIQNSLRYLKNSNLYKVINDFYFKDL